MNIGGHVIARDGSPYIIAELGVNHDGNVGRALAMVDAAAAAGANAIKLQLFRAELLMSAAARAAKYQERAGEGDPVAMLKRLELSTEELEQVCERAHERGVHAIVTVFSCALVDEAEGMSIDAYKVASPDIVHRPLLEALARTGKPLIVSTGAATMDEVKRAAGWLDGVQERMALLQCVSAYPTPTEQAALEGIGALRGAFAGMPIGYSDHTAGVETGARAVELGAAILEKHFTYDRHAKGPDHAASLDAERFAEYVRCARATVHRPVDDGAKRVQDIEQDVRAVSRQSIVTTRPVAAGEEIAREDLTFKRPGTGLEPWEVEEVVGRRAARDIHFDVPMVREDVK